MAKQSRQDRELRLSEGRCPIHGCWMPQGSNIYEDDGTIHTIVECPRKSCDIKAEAHSPNGPYELLRDFEYLLYQNDSGTAKIIGFRDDES